jgi:virginiamycin B lyase
MKRRVRAIVAVLLTLETLLGGLVVPPIAAADADQAEMLTANSLALAITAGPDGNLWFTGLGSNTISRIAPNGTVTGEYRLPTPNSLPNSITVGPDGNLWFTELDANKIGRMTTTGVIVDGYPIPTPDSHPTGIITGPEGDLWFTELGTNRVGRIHADTGVITEYRVSVPNNLPARIIAGPDRSLWFTELGTNKIGQATLDGAVYSYPILSQAGLPNGIIPGCPAADESAPDAMVCTVGRAPEVTAIFQIVLTITTPDQSTVVKIGWISTGDESTGSTVEIDRSPSARKLRSSDERAGNGTPEPA